MKTAWEYKFNLFLDENIKSGEDFNQQLITGFQLFKFIGDFRTRAVDCCKSIIDEIHLNSTEFTHGAREITSESRESQSERSFLINNCLIRITWPEKKAQNFNEFEEAELYFDKTGHIYGHGKMSLIFLMNRIQSYGYIK